MDKRKLVTLRTIDSITPIAGADSIEAAHIGGWTSVVRKGEFSEGQKVFYFETDSMLPLNKKPFMFLRSRGVTKYDGQEYHLLKAMRLRGVISDGLVMPISILKDFTSRAGEEEDDDYTDLFGVLKYEDPIDSGSLQFPNWLSKTNELRIQNLPELVDYIAKTNSSEAWYATEKIDGTSCTIWCDGDCGVCSHNYGLTSGDNVYWNIAKTPSINYEGRLLSPLDYLKAKSSGYKRLALQGEIFGEGIQNNPLGIKGQRILFFNLNVNGAYITMDTVKTEYKELLDHWVPIHPISLQPSMEQIIAQPDKVTTLVSGAKPVQIEGFVWRNKKAIVIKLPGDEYLRASFKVIADRYRLKHS